MGTRRLTRTTEEDPAETDRVFLHVKVDSTTASMYYRNMNEQAITAKSLTPGDIITQGTLPNGTVATVDVHDWTVTVTYTDGREAFTSVLAILHVESITDRLEELRAAIRAENISWGELAELQNLAPFIPKDDTELLEWAGVPEFEVTDHVWVHSVPTLTVGQECAICDRPRAEHEMEEGEH